MIKAGIIGASGYTGLELIKILSTHSNIELSAFTSEKYAGEEVSSVFPSLKNIICKKFDALSVGRIIKECDVVFTALPHKFSMSVVPELIEAGKKVVDLSADYRLNDHLVYEKWYAAKHTSPELIKTAVYGIPELNRKKIVSTSLIANPGCYSTSIILALAPVVKNELMEKGSLIIDSKSGISGAGRGASVNLLYSERNESVKAYNVTCHKHIPEIEQELSSIAGSHVAISFTPHLIPMTRGLLSTIYCTLKRKTGVDELIELYNHFYKGERFVRIAQHNTSVDTHSVMGSNYCDIAVHIDAKHNRAIIVSVIDNLVKGASGQAVQNMNIMCGFKEGTALG